MHSFHLIPRAFTATRGVVNINSMFLRFCSFLLVLFVSGGWCQQDTASADTSKAVPAKDSMSAGLASKSQDSTLPFLIIGFTPHILYENIAAVEVGLDEYLSIGPQKWGDNITGSGIAFGFLFPVKLSFLMVYYHVKATIHWAVPKDSTVVQTLLTGTNELRIGEPLTIYNMPFEYIPMIGIGLNNCAIGYATAQGRIRGGGMEYFFSYTISLTIRQPFHISKRFYSMGLSIDFEKAFTWDDNTKQRLVFALLLGL